MPDSSILPIDKTLSSAITLPLRVWVDLQAIAMKGYPEFYEAPTLLEPHLRLFCIVSSTFIGRVCVLPRFGDAVGLISCHSRLGYIYLCVS